MIEHKVFPDGSQEWRLNGKRHREDGPAYIDSSGYQVWFQNGQFHRIDGPAVIYPYGRKEWWQNGVYLGDCEPNFSINDWTKEGF